MSGVTTTPHLHFQIDKADAPFHAYWPYTFRDAQDLGLDFFDAVNVGLGKENAIKYTVHPLDFVQDLSDGQGQEAPIVPDVKVAAGGSNGAPQTIVTGVVVTPKPTTPTVVVPPLNAAPDLDSKPPVSPIVAVKPTVPDGQAFRDIGRNSVYFTATKYLKDSGVSQGYDDATFRPDTRMTRRDAVILLARTFGIEAQAGAESTFPDVPKTDSANGYIAALKAKGVIQGSFVFRPDDIITKTEFANLVVRLSGDQVSTTTRIPQDVATLSYFSSKSGYRVTRFQSNIAVTRGEGARMLYMWKNQS